MRGLTFISFSLSKHQAMPCRRSRNYSGSRPLLRRGIPISRRLGGQRFRLPASGGYRLPASNRFLHLRHLSPRLPTLRQPRTSPRCREWRMAWKRIGQTRRSKLADLRRHSGRCCAGYEPGYAAGNCCGLGAQTRTLRSGHPRSLGPVLGPALALRAIPITVGVTVEWLATLALVARSAPIRRG